MLADTDVLIDFLKRKGEAQRVAEALTSQVCLQALFQRLSCFYEENFLNGYLR